jgi:K319L-like, PKD domain
MGRPARSRSGSRCVVALLSLLFLIFTSGPSQADPRASNERDAARATARTVADGSRTSEREVRDGRRSASLAVVTDQAQLVQTIATSGFSPASPDPAGVAYIPSRDRLLIADSEVDERTGAGYHGVNLWQITRTGNVDDTGTTVGYTDEPTGLSFDPGSETLFISTDSGNRIHLVRSGTDGRFGTSDDVRSAIATGPYGLTDTEDPAFDPSSGHLFFVDGVTAEVYDLDPVDGIIGNSNDRVTHFDVARYGATDTEGLAYNPTTGTLLVGDRPSRKIYEVTKAGALIRVIDASGIAAMKRISGLEVAPGSGNGSGLNIWIVDRAVDNGSNSSENDGRLFEVRAPSITMTNSAPTVNAGADRTIALNAVADLNGSVTDDGLPDPPGTVTSLWSKVSGSGTVTFGDVASPTTTASFSATGTYVLRLTASDSEAQGTDDVTVTVVPEGTGSIDIAVSTGSDDAEESSAGGMLLTRKNLRIVLAAGSPQTVGLRFASIAIPQGSAIIGAYVQFRVDNPTSGATTLAIRGQASDNAATFTTATANISSRPRTAATATWSPPAWTTVGATGSAQRTADLSLVIQEIVNRAGWSEGHALALIITGQGKRVADSFEGGFGPILHVEFAS